MCGSCALRMGVNHDAISSILVQGIIVGQSLPGPSTYLIPIGLSTVLVVSYLGDILRLCSGVLVFQGSWVDSTLIVICDDNSSTPAMWNMLLVQFTACVFVGSMSYLESLLGRLKSIIFKFHKRFLVSLAVLERVVPLV